MFETWQKRDGLKGLPVGLDSSSVLGMAFLRDADVALERQGIVHGRWVDEFTIVGPARGTCRPAIGVLQLALAGLKLSLSEQKTHIDPPAEGLASQDAR